MSSTAKDGSASSAKPEKKIVLTKPADHVPAKPSTAAKTATPTLAESMAFAAKPPTSPVSSPKQVEIKVTEVKAKSADAKPVAPTKQVEVKKTVASSEVKTDVPANAPPKKSDAKKPPLPFMGVVAEDKAKEMA